MPLEGFAIAVTLKFGLTGWAMTGIGIAIFFFLILRLLYKRQR